MSLLEARQRRILTTHVGSLPRPQSLSAKLFARMSGQSYDAKALSDELHQAVGDIVKKQAELGVDRKWAGSIHALRQRRQIENLVRR